MMMTDKEKALERELGAVREELGHAHAHSSDQVREISGLKEEIARYKAKFESLENERKQKQEAVESDALQSMVEQLKTTNQSLRREIEQVRTTTSPSQGGGVRGVRGVRGVGDLKRENEELRSQLTAARASISDLEKELKGLKDVRAQENPSAAATAKEVAELKEVLAKSNATLEKFKAQTMKLMNEIKAIKAVKQKVQTVPPVPATIEGEEARRIEQEREGEGKVEGRREEIDTLRSRIAELEAHGTKQHHQIAELEASLIERARTAYPHPTGQAVPELEQQLSRKTALIEDQKAREASNFRKIEAMSKEIDSLKQQQAQHSDGSHAVRDQPSVAITHEQEGERESQRVV